MAVTKDTIHLGPSTYLGFEKDAIANCVSEIDEAAITAAIDNVKPLVITAATTFVQDSKILPTLTSADLENIYNAMAKGQNCVIVSNNATERFVVQQADNIAGSICIVFSHYHDSIITYEDGDPITVTITDI